MLGVNATSEKRKEADVVTSGASDRGSKVGLDGEVAGQGRWFLPSNASMPARPSGQVGPRYPGPCTVGLPGSWAGQAGTQAGAGTVAARSAANDSNGTRSVTGNGPPPEPLLNQQLLYLQSTVATAFGAVRYFRRLTPSFGSLSCL